MDEPSFEELFSSCLLEVAVPDTSIEFPENALADEWLASLNQPQVDRKQAFFGKEQSCRACDILKS